ncbi:LysE/ArgO family amino acid transporter [Bacillus atrophaeus]|uniref:LysE/ArgO family amino acid transporter n=1 Tax=Bacillus atrophaeus TaxID=1452 RepID=UPI002DBEEFBF|nr:LysE family transporter [Bacillus atrophaeus]
MSAESFLVSAVLKAQSRQDVVVQQIPVFETIMLTCGFLFPAYMGWVTWHSRPDPDETQKNVFSAKKQAAFAAAVSLLNPHAILDTAGVIGTQSFPYTGLDKWLYTLSCIAVSWVWFIVLVLAVRIFKTLDTGGGLMIVLNKCSALVMRGAAIYLGAALLY